MSYHIVHLIILICIYMPLVRWLQISWWFWWRVNLWLVWFFLVGWYASSIFWIYSVLLPLFGIEIVLLVLVREKLIESVDKEQRTVFSFITWAVIYWLSFMFENYTWWAKWKLLEESLALSYWTQTIAIGYSVLCVCVWVWLVVFTRSRWWRILQFVRDDKKWVALLGVNPEPLLKLAIALSTILAMFSWVLYSQYIWYVDPKMWSLNVLVLVVAAVMVWWLGSIQASSIWLTIIIVLPELLRLIFTQPELVWPVRTIVFCVILLFIIVYKPYGLMWRIKSTS